MNLRSTALIVCALAFASCAGQRYRANIGPMFAKTSGSFALGPSTGPIPNGNEIDGNMGLGESEASPYVRLATDIDEHRVRVHGFFHDTDGSGALSNNYGNIAAPAAVNNSMDFFSVAANYGYQLWRGDWYRVAGGMQLGYYSLEVTARTGSSGREQVTADVLVPMPFVEGELFWRDFTFGGSLGGMVGDFGDGDGNYIDFDTYVDWQFHQNYDVMLGYRHIIIDADGRASSRDFDANIDVAGIYISAGIRF